MTIWYRDPSSLLQNWTAIIPTRAMPFDEQLNASVRFAFFFTSITFLIKRDPNIFMVLFATMFVTIAMFHVDKKTHTTTTGGGGISSLQQQTTPEAVVCRVPTKDNPFMNPVYGVDEATMRTNSNKACDTTRPSVKKQVAASYDKTLLRNVDDLWQNQSSDRQFYTVPCTDVCSDQNGFSKWLYGTVGSSRNSPPPSGKTEENKNDVKNS